ncbi:MAG: GNAT family N-acetyltransferase [Actinomycetota bacterium]
MQEIDENTPGAVEVTTWHLEITDPSAVPDASTPRRAGEIVVAQEMTTAFARWLYRHVGEPWHWTDRHALDDDGWSAIISSPDYRHITCMSGGVPVGYCEYELQGSSVEIVYFGLGTEVHGHGLGGWFLTEAMRHGFGYDGVERVWLHTCSLDGPHARANYEARGFTLFATEIEWKVLD